MAGYPINTLYNIATIVFGISRCKEVLRQATDKEIFGRALLRVKGALPKKWYSPCRILIFGMDAGREDLLKCIDSVNSGNIPGTIQPSYCCNNEGCSDDTTLRCSRCKLVAYCSKHAR